MSAPHPDVEWGCKPEWPQVGSQANPGGLVAAPDHTFVRKVHHSGKAAIPGTDQELEFWGFEDETGDRLFPSPIIRVRQDTVSQVTLEATFKVHTIHFHGIEPEPYNDGVGHTSWEVSGNYTYQWKASQAGTFWYHCHVNTVLHVHMGMFGMLIVDPPTGPGTAYAGGPAYNVERIWPATMHDLTWASKGHAAGLCGDDEGLNDVNPTVFAINGVVAPATQTDQKVSINCKVGDTVLIRHLNASYFPQEVSFGGLEGEVIASDGHPFHNGASFMTTRLRTSPAERYDILLRPTAPGRYVGGVEYYHWSRGHKVGSAPAVIDVAAA